MKKFKTILYLAVFLFIAVSSAFRSTNQIVTLLTAYKENRILEHSIERLEYENKILERKIQEATSSSYKEQMVRKKLGLGTEDDVWIILPSGKDFEELYPKINLGDKKPNWLQWVELFTVN